MTKAAGIAAKKEARRYLILDHVERIREADVLAVLLRVREFTGEILQTLPFRASLRVCSYDSVCCRRLSETMSSDVSQNTQARSSQVTGSMQDAAMMHVLDTAVCCRLGHGSLPDQSDSMGLQRL